MSIKLYDHNETAYHSVLKMLDNKTKAAVIHPTGTGKSFIAFKLCEDKKDKRIVWVSPSEYIFKTQIENIKESTPDFGGDNISFLTYAKLMNMSYEDIDALRPDYIILDEFHRAGADEWGKGVQSLIKMHPKAYLLGLSATNIRYLDNQRDMADELFGGNIASEMTLGEAVVRGILNPPEYIISMYSYQSELEKYEQRIKDKRFKSVKKKAEKYLEELRRALEMADGIDKMFAKHIKDKEGKYIVFCANYEHMTEMVKLAHEWFFDVDREPNIYKAYSNNPETSRAFASFKKDKSSHLKLLYCIDMLNEGVHLDDISGVILLRPTVSPIIYKQQIGRAMSASKSTRPVIFDIVNNFENLYSISAIEDEMHVAMSYYRHTGECGNIVNEHFKIVDEMRNCRELFEALEDTLVFSWDVMYDMAKRYYQQHRDLEIPKDYKTEEGYSLGNWISTQRKVKSGKQAGNLDETRIKKLDAIGMRWGNVYDVVWDKFFGAAKRYYEQNGNLDIGIGYITEDRIALGKWISQLRTYKKSGIKTSYLTEERVEELDKLGMIWNVPDYLWERNYSAALEYYRKFGNLDVEAKYVSDGGIKLGQWIAKLRRLRNTNSNLFNLTEEQIGLLDYINMQWSGKYERQWWDGYKEAKRYFDRNGNLSVPNAYIAESGFRLGAWISNQREYAKRISIERRSKLDEIGMIWEKPDSWEIRFELARKYFEQHGNLDVPPDYTEEGIWLNKWLNEQKHIYFGNRKNKRLSKQQIARLESIGMDWKNSAQRAWDVRYDAVFKFYKEFGHINIPKDYVLSDGRKIGNWFVRQRKYKREEKLTASQIEKLNSIGMQWGRKAS